VVASDTEKAYAAGLFDGEGSVIIQRREKDGCTPSTMLVVSVTITTPAAVDFLRATFGGYTNSWQPRGNRQRAHRWRLRGEAAFLFLQDVFPYLIIKREHAKVGIEFQSARPRYGGRQPLSDSELWIDLEYYEEMKRLNKKGRWRD